MKTVFSKINLTALALFLLVAPGFTSCDKDDDNKETDLRVAIVGDWEVTSFTIDGVEVVGTIVLASKMEFEAYTGSNGDFEWLINYGDGSSENQSGDYEVAGVFPGGAPHPGGARSAPSSAGFSPTTLTHRL